VLFSSVELLGHPYDVDAVLETTRRYPIAVVDDAAEALGATYRGRLREAAWARSSYWMPSVLLDEQRCPDVRALNADGVEVRPLWRPLHRQPAYRDAQAYRVEVADRLYARGLSLPCSVGITSADREVVTRALLARLT
jgi:dTDP-4-amino-4,6-dideoxygalactose transaminase